MKSFKCFGHLIWAVLVIYVAFHSHVAAAGTAAVSARTWEDCKTTKMVLLNSNEFKGLEVYKFFRGLSIGSSRDCSDQCLRDLNCYAFNYAKLTKWCFLGYTHQRYLRSVDNPKMESGYRQCSTHSTDDGWTSEVFTVAGAPSSVVATAKTDTSMIMTYIDGATGNPDERYSAKCVAYGLGCSSPAIGISLSYNRGIQSIPVSGLTASTRYYCYVVVTNTVGTVCSPALTLTTCAAGLSC